MAEQRPDAAAGVTPSDGQQLEHAGLRRAAKAAPSAAAGTSGAPAQAQPDAQPQQAPVPPQPQPDQRDAASSDDDAFGAAGPTYADEACAFEQRHGRGGAASPAQQPFDDDAWDMGKRFREPRATQQGEAADAPADAEAAEADEGQPPEVDVAPPEEILSPEEIQVHVCFGIMGVAVSADRVSQLCFACKHRHSCRSMC